MAFFRKNDSNDFSGYIRKGVKVKGSLNFDNGLFRLDGTFNGEIHSEGTLAIGDSAIVEAEIYVDNVIISGQFTGNIFAKIKVHLHAPAKVYGNISTPQLIIEEGVLFEGQSLYLNINEDELKPLILPDNNKTEKQQEENKKSKEKNK